MTYEQVLQEDTKALKEASSIITYFKLLKKLYYANGSERPIDTFQLLDGEQDVNRLISYIDRGIFVSDKDIPTLFKMLENDVNILSRIDVSSNIITEEVCNLSNILKEDEVLKELTNRADKILISNLILLGKSDISKKILKK